MTASRLALVADDPRLAGQIQASLEKAFGRRAAQAGLDAVRGQLTAALYPGGGQSAAPSSDTTSLSRPRRAALIHAVT